MAAAGELPVNVRVLIEGEEEVGSRAVQEWLATDRRGADAAIVFDSGMVDAQTPGITIGLRGLVQLSFEVRTGTRDLHSGMWGGTALNALHAVHSMIAAVLPGPDGRVPEPLRVGIEPLSEQERRALERLPDGAGMLAAVGGRELYPGAAAEYHARNGADASLDVNEVHGGAARTVLPVSAGATLSIRLAPRQDPDAMGDALVEMLRAAAPAGAELEILHRHQAHPSLFAPDEPVIRLAAEAMERATGTAPVLERSGGSIPIVASFAQRGIPTVTTGFVLPDDAFHAPNESFHLRGLELGERAARELLSALARL
jgi:acetylornithine deacetylase/succinyl-diaminopimelate desuccinylase-like protein